MFGKEHMEEQRRSFVYGNCAIENPLVTREMVDKVADEMEQIERTGGVPPTGLTEMVAAARTTAATAGRREREDSSGRATVTPSTTRQSGIRLISGVLECDDGVVITPLYINLSREEKRDLVQSLLENMKC
jgi:hypothetical protein